jgi:hypothetical protein
MGLSSSTAPRRPAGRSPGFPDPIACSPAISPDGQAIATAADDAGRTLALYHRAGWDCPESHLGALVFPQTWLTAALLPALCWSLSHDARRSHRTTATGAPSPLVRIGLIVIALPFNDPFRSEHGLGNLPSHPRPPAPHRRNRTGNLQPRLAGNHALAAGGDSASEPISQLSNLPKRREQRDHPAHSGSILSRPAVVAVRGTLCGGPIARHRHHALGTLKTRRPLTRLAPCSIFPMLDLQPSTEA